jgi:hypothetical protein
MIGKTFFRSVLVSKNMSELNIQEPDELDPLNVQLISSAYKEALDLPTMQMWRHFHYFTILWSQLLRSTAIGLLDAEHMNLLSQRVSSQLSSLLSKEDKRLFRQLKFVRNCLDKPVMISATKLLLPDEIIKLKKMIVLQNVVSGNKPSQKPWESKTRKPSPKRREPSEKITRKDLVFSTD